MILAIILLTALINLLLGIISYTKNPKSATNQLLSTLTVIFALWTIANYFSLNTPSESGTLFWIRAVMFITTPLGPILYLFIRAFPNAKLTISKQTFSLLIFLTLIVEALAFTPFLFSKVTIGKQITPTPEPGLILFAFLFVGTPLLSFFTLLKKYRRSKGAEKLQLWYLIFGIILTFLLLIITNFVLVVLFKFSQLVIFGPIFSLIFIGFVFYAIVKHRLLQIRRVIARSVAYMIMIVIVGAIYTIGIFLISKYILQSSFTNEQLFISVFLAFFVIFSFERIKTVIEHLTDKFFFKGRYNSDELILELATLTASTYSLKTLTNNTLEKILSTLRIQKGVFIIMRKNGTTFTIYSGSKSNYVYNHDSIEKLIKTQQMIIFDEEKNERRRQLMQKFDMFVSVPLIEQDNVVGILLLGDKKSGEMYTEQDIKILEIFGPLIALAIQNAKSYEEIKRFNKTLSEKVQNATEELLESHAKLKTLDQQKDAFLGMASHELKTPITSIKAFTQVLLKKMEHTDQPSYTYILKIINTQTDRITQLINDLLNISHIESGKLVLKKEEFDLNKLVVKTIADIQVTTDTHTILKKGKLTMPIYGDANRIEQVLSNLLTNAIKYSPTANQIIVTLSENTKETTVAIQDFGQGIALKDQKKVFKRFYRIRENEERNIAGFGLGLFISSEIIRRHKGKIWVESRIGKGSTFCFAIPRLKN
ncbi:MAG: ATP-binding protein [Candidatus Levyibacteriota bacterium]